MTTGQRTDAHSRPASLSLSRMSDKPPVSDVPSLQLIHEHVPKASTNIRVAFSFAALVTTLILYGVLQERIMTNSYGGEYVQSTLLLVLYNRITTAALCAVLMIVNGEPLRPVIPAYRYAVVSFANITATSCQFEALKYVSFPVQTLAKAGKMIPVMIWSTLILKRKYKLTDYAVAFLVMTGCSLFLVMGNVSSKNLIRGGQKGSTGTGFGLLFLHLFFDGLASTMQDKLFRSYQMSAYAQTFYVTLCSSLISLCGVIFNGELVSGMSCVLRHNSLLLDMTLLSLVATLSQLLISWTIKAYGALLFATVQTTRQFLSILLSCILFGHPLTEGQTFGTAIVFTALFFRLNTSFEETSRSETDKSLASILLHTTEHDSNSEPLKDKPISNSEILSVPAIIKPTRTFIT